jgi:hypothetical protein
MSAMSLPGFTAEASVYKTKVHYQMASALNQADGVSSPQFIFGRDCDCGPCGLSGGVCSMSCKCPHGCIVGAPECTIMEFPCSPTACRPTPPPPPPPAPETCCGGLVGTGTQCTNTCTENCELVSPYGMSWLCEHNCGCCCYNNAPPSQVGPLTCGMVPWYAAAQCKP